MGDFGTALIFWLSYEALSLPLRWGLTPFAVPEDVRRLLSRVAGPALVAMAAGLLAHGPVELGRGTGWLLAGGAGVAGLVLAGRRGGRSGLRAALLDSLPVRGARWRRDLAIEGALLATFLAYVAFRRLAPEMTFEIQNSGAEKFPNAMLFWSCWHARTLPPEDYWFAGLTQRYYYGGHFFWSWVGRLGGFPAGSVIALGLTRTVTLVVEAGFVLLRALGLRWRSALAGAMLMAWGGNPQAWLTLGQQVEYHTRGRSLIEGQTAAEIAANFERVARDWDWGLYSFWEPSRVIAHTVNEFPAWSAILGDFHAHHLALPWLMGWFALLARGDAWLTRRRDGTPGGGVEMGLGALVFGGLGVTACLSNVWSLPVVLAATPVVLLWRGRGSRFPFGAVCVAGLAAGCVAGLRLGGQDPLAPLGAETAGGGGGVTGNGWPVQLLDAALRSGDGELLRLWGFQVAALVAAVGAYGLGRGRERRVAVWMAAGVSLMALKLLVFNGVTVGRSEPALYGMGLACGVIAGSQGRRPWFTPRAAAAGAGACLLLAGLELFYVRDRMTGELARYNSYFKFSYAAWPLLSAVAWIGAVRLWHAPRRGWPRAVVRAAMIPAIPALAGMLVFGVPARVLQARIGDAGPRAATLDGFAWLANRPGYEAEAAALAWIREHVEVGRVVITAAPASAYSYQGRVASLAGRPVPLGWAHHEAQWRGAGIYAALEERHQRVNAVYLAGDAGQIREAAAALGARWVLMGKNERDTYGAAAFDETLAILREAAVLRASFPESSPEVYVFELIES